MVVEPRLARLAAIVLLAGVSLAAPPSVASRDALHRFFETETSSFVFYEKKNALELCWDVCEYYEMGKGPSVETWDAIFLH